MILHCLIGNEKSGRKITAIEYKKVNAGLRGDKQLKAFEIKYKSAHGDCYNGSYGMVNNFTLKNNITGEGKEHKIKIV